VRLAAFFTGYESIAIAVEAIKLGASHYLAKLTPRMRSSPPLVAKPAIRRCP